MKSRPLLILTCCTVLIFAAGSHFGVRNYFRACRLETQVENMTVRTRLMKQQMGEWGQKLRIIQRVNGFVDHARDLQLTPEGWAQYDVNVQDALSFRELARMIGQCEHNKDLYYLPLSFHVTTQQAKNASDAAGEELKAIARSGDASGQPAADLALSLKGAFFVRQ
jgi:hypothetical protein